MKTQEVTKKLIDLDKDMSGDADISAFHDSASKLLKEVVSHLSKSPSDASTRELFNEATRRADVFIGVDDLARRKLDEIGPSMNYARLFCGKVARLRERLDQASPMLTVIAHAIRQAAIAKPVPETATKPGVLDSLGNWIKAQIKAQWSAFADIVASFQLRVAMSAASKPTDDVSVDHLSKALEHFWFKLDPAEQQCLKVRINPVGPVLGVDVHESHTRRVLSHKLDGGHVRLEHPGLKEPVVISIKEGSGMKKLPFRRLSGSPAELRLSIQLPKTDDWHPLCPVVPGTAPRRRATTKKAKSAKKKK